MGLDFGRGHARCRKLDARGNICGGTHWWVESAFVIVCTKCETRYRLDHTTGADWEEVDEEGEEKPNG